MNQKEEDRHAGLEKSDREIETLKWIEAKPNQEIIAYGKIIKYIGKQTEAWLFR